jgi:hypothetical protein
MTLTPLDDFPIHQTPDPLSKPVSGDPNHYDRYFFNGFDPGGEWFFGVALGVYPNLGVIDGAFSFVRDGVQTSVFASGRAPLDRRQTRVGPVRIEVVEPLGANRVLVGGSESSLTAALEWIPRTPAVAEPRQTLNEGSISIDTTRFVQLGAWSGWISLDDVRLDIDANTSRGTKDRSWGTRPVGDAGPSAPSAPTGIFFLWSPVHFEGRGEHVILFERPDGFRTYESVFTIPRLGEGDPVWGPDVKVDFGQRVEYELRYRSGTRRAETASMRFETLSGRSIELEYHPILDFQMKGLGYLHPTWKHGRWHGEESVGAETWKLDELDPLAPDNIHVQQLCRVTSGGEEGVGVLEQLVFGPHAPTGLRDFLDGGA